MMLTMDGVVGDPQGSSGVREAVREFVPSLLVAGTTSTALAVQRAGEGSVTVVSLASSSRGNCYLFLVRDGGGRQGFIWELGVTPREFESRLKDVGLIYHPGCAKRDSAQEPSNDSAFTLAGAFVSHRHKDHCHPDLVDWAVQRGIPLHVTDRFLGELSQVGQQGDRVQPLRGHVARLQGSIAQAHSLDQLRVIQEGGSLRFSSCIVSLDELSDPAHDTPPHDVPNACLNLQTKSGFRIFAATDFGHITDRMRRNLSSAHAALLEGNYTVSSLEAAPPPVAARIRQSHFPAVGLAGELWRLSQGPNGSLLQVLTIVHPNAGLVNDVAGWSQLLETLRAGWDGSRSGRGAPALVRADANPRHLFSLISEGGSQVLLSDRVSKRGIDNIVAVPFGGAGIGAVVEDGPGEQGIDLRNRGGEGDATSSPCSGATFWKKDAGESDLALLTIPTPGPAIRPLVREGGVDLIFDSRGAVVTGVYVTPAGHFAADLLSAARAKWQALVLWDPRTGSFRVHAAPDFLGKIKRVFKEGGAAALEGRWCCESNNREGILIVSPKDSRQVSLREPQAVLNIVRGALLHGNESSIILQEDHDRAGGARLLDRDLQLPHLQLRWFNGGDIVIERHRVAVPLQGKMTYPRAFVQSPRVGFLDGGPDVRCPAVVIRFRPTHKSPLPGGELSVAVRVAENDEHLVRHESLERFAEDLVQGAVFYGCGEAWQCAMEKRGGQQLAVFTTTTVNDPGTKTLVEVVRIAHQHICGHQQTREEEEL